MTACRIAQQPAYVLHHYDWSEFSLILETFTRQHGRVALVAKGAKRPSSSLRPVLLPLQPLLLGWRTMFRLPDIKEQVKTVVIDETVINDNCQLKLLTADGQEYQLP